MKDNRRILVIDDDQGIRETYLSIFSPRKETDVILKGRELFGEFQGETSLPERQGYEITVAENGITGIEIVKDAMARNMPFAAAFIDMKMPGLDGAQTSQKIWEIDPGIKILIVTAYSDYTPEEIIAVTGREDIFYLRKPFNQEEIYQFARALVNGWNLERRRLLLEDSLQRANQELEDINQNLRKKVEKQASLIVQTEKMASVGILAAGVAHEINNPIAFISSNLSAVKKYFKRILSLYNQYSEVEIFLEKLGSEEALWLLGRIHRSKAENKIDLIMADLENLADESIDGVDRIKCIVQDLKTFSRIDSSEYSLIDINRTINTTLKIIWNEIKYKAVVEKNYGEIPEIRGFPQKISQMFMNLLLNAAQAIEDKGKISITTRLILKGRRERDRWIEVRISDTGCGISEQNIPRLFDPFFTTKPVGKGTGLGLSIVYEIVKAHEGSIDVTSSPGDGTCFTLLLPAAGSQ